MTQSAPRALAIRTGSAEETHAVGAALGRTLPNGAVLSLEGALGSGKTVLARGICAGAGVETEVTSPTYTLQNIHEAADGRRVVHMDCFRLDGPGELDALGFSELLDGETLVLLEWGDRVLPALPPDTVRIRLESDGESRRIRILLPAGVHIRALEGGEL
ncbi:MAG: tRNA (adenosine(37)-N6)-threonylcarbamoyltransferase complex ATPase subunit type 1 TsaE [Gemmatimonadota bacterium]|jgi:tRNA threonylcarbamoyladenosine biosynthesis protein TsaE|nr:tRNA (adenosine(37)-N6)-threonylcarbamoyltransferase complex ATPase subunit type 1 TsaE [Gemmatimonadota bacterium]MDP6528769.1 tRNA (adenosine(37)-N6)-threonylcarbamoyltransferase complex ATPase subunit type 1 TsaE [Gemmatimonadota bacterium]MDP6803174.1 tRNA (adenosine(37)-N6)-threonylcarbamoyltransferase complex ATPase subunit type 1 TsaE [Gemmatimonadota bacterium]MDP7031288.1 tRNA (adenosine(37)-N6)-threonylcarbamoyltransferase complex ATPase subunit type 1 TsaE [Gemmatimonadota bacteriu